MMSTADLALRADPAYEKISRHYYENPAEFADAFSKAWYKLTHRDMGPLERYLGSEVPAEAQLWQDPVPAVDHELVSDQDVADLKSKILESIQSAFNDVQSGGKKVSLADNNVHEGRDRVSGDLKWTGSTVDLLFGSNSELRAVAEVYASSDAQP